MASPAKLRGRWGESVAAEFLRKKGYTVVGMGYVTRFGEVDIIAENRKFLVFAEVKLRKNPDFAQAREFVDRRKRERLITSAKLYLQENETKKQPRFDVVEIYAPEGTDTRSPEIIHIENAFGEES